MQKKNQQTVLEAAKALVERARSRGKTGTVADLQELERLNRDMGGRIPDWYARLMTTVPLCGLELGWQFDPDDEEDGIAWLEWSDLSTIRSESLECYPGLAILERGYINVAGDVAGGGDPFFIPTDQGDDPPLYQIYHDVSEDADAILAEGRELVASSLSEFFRAAKIEEA